MTPSQHLPPHHWYPSAFWISGRLVFILLIVYHVFTEGSGHTELFASFSLYLKDSVSRLSVLRTEPGSTFAWQRVWDDLEEPSLPH